MRDVLNLTNNLPTQSSGSPRCRLLQFRSASDEYRLLPLGKKTAKPSAKEIRRAAFNFAATAISTSSASGNRTGSEGSCCKRKPTWRAAGGSSSQANKPQAGLQPQTVSIEFRNCDGLRCPHH